MAKIRIIRGGCGITYNDEHGTARHALRTPEHDSFVCDDAQAARLVRLGVAAYVTEHEAATECSEAPAAGSNEPEQTPGREPEKATCHLDLAQLEFMDYNELKKLAADMGATPKSNRKADLIEAIAAAEVEPGDEVDPDDEDGLPDLSAANPE